MLPCVYIFSTYLYVYSNEPHVIRGVKCRAFCDIYALYEPVLLSTVQKQPNSANSMMSTGEFKVQLRNSPVTESKPLDGQQTVNPLKSDNDKLKQEIRQLHDFNNAKAEHMEVQVK